jgi:regulator of nucleoside diphosphate kinase
MLPNICISSRDFERIETLLDSLPVAYSAIKERLQEEMARADIVAPEAIAPTVVTMNSRVTFTVISTGQTMTRTLVYPRDQEGSADKISLLTPMGSALLGLAVGQEIEWFIEPTKTMRVHVDAIEYQPERAGHFHL